VKWRLLFAAFAVLPLCGQVKFTRQPDRIDVTVDGKPFTSLFIEGTNKPYLYPLRAASGTVVTRGYPADRAKGETVDHPHQKGLWFTHGVVNGFNYWANEPSQIAPETGRVVLRRIVALESGDKAGSMRLVFDWLDPQGKPILTEERTTVFRSGPKLRVMDFDFVLTPHTRVVFQDSTEGFFAVRLAAGLEEPSPRSPAVPRRTGKMVNSEGKESEANCWGERASWIDYAGELDGEKLGVASSTIRPIPGTRPSGIPAVTGCLRRTPSGCSTSTPTR
jgi:hypothetical protein